MKTAIAGFRRIFNRKMKVFAGMLNVLSSRSATGKLFPDVHNVSMSVVID